MTEVIAASQLKQYIERIEKLEQDKTAIAEDIKQVYDQAKFQGFDAKIMKQIIKIKKLDPNARAEQEAILELYISALGI